MKAIEVIEKTAGYAKEYRRGAKLSLQRNNHMNDLVDGEFVNQIHIDAVLVDFINFVASKHGIDYGLYTSDFKK